MTSLRLRKVSIRPGCVSTHTVSNSNTPTFRWTSCCKIKHFHFDCFFLNAGNVKKLPKLNEAVGVSYLRKNSFKRTKRIHELWLRINWVVIEASRIIRMKVLKSMDKHPRRLTFFHQNILYIVFITCSNISWIQNMKAFYTQTTYIFKNLNNQLSFFP